MKGEWVNCTIGDIADIVGGSTPSTSDPSNFDGSIPWLTPKDLAGQHDRYVTRGERNLSEKGLQSCSARLLPPGTVLLTSRAPIGYVAIAKTSIATNQGFRSLVLKPGVDSEYIYYWLKAHVEELERYASGSTFRELTGSALAQIRIRIPPLPEQRAIAHILGTLDDKIELNRRMSETLEQMARAIFKAWFVDFVPVRAKMEGRWQRGQSLPGLPAHLYDLFPARLVDSELGEIPEGWELVLLENVIEFVKGKKPIEISNTRRENYYPLILIETFDSGTPVFAPGEDAVLTEPDDILMVVDGASSGRVETGYEGVVGSTIAKLKLKKQLMGKRFLYYYLKTTERELRKHTTGTSIPHTDREWLLQQRVCLPGKGKFLTEVFESLACDVRERIRGNSGQSRTLAALRDALLPKLIRGEIRVKDAEKLVLQSVPSIKKED